MTGRHSAGQQPGGPGDPGNIEGLLADALQAHARAAVGDDRLPPEPRFDTHPRASARTHGRRGRLAPFAAAAAVIVIAGGAAGIAAALSGGDEPNSHRAGTQQADHAPSHTATHTAPTSAAQSSTASAAPGVPVKMTTHTGTGKTYGVGMPVIAYFSRKITNAAALQSLTTVTVNGALAHGAWYFEPSNEGNGPVEGHFRMAKFWPAHSVISVQMPVAGRSAGHGMSFANNLSVQFRTGAANVSVVNDKTHLMTVSSDGRVIARYPVSLGASMTPTERGTKVIMQKGLNICMHGPGYDECDIKWTQRLTYGGEYLHSAPWNIVNIKSGTDSSNGCTNLMPANAQQLYAMSAVGDVVEYPNANGPKMQVGSGLGDWNVSWATWLRGGSVPTS